MGWLTDTAVYFDAWEIVAEKARRFWWSQQVDLAMLSFSTLLAIEGRRRNIPLLWGYLVLAHLVNLSFAQNLFYVALLLTPSPILSSDHSSMLGSRSRSFDSPRQARNTKPSPDLLGSGIQYPRLNPRTGVRIPFFFCQPSSSISSQFPYSHTRRARSHSPTCSS